jgi:hypothetical protein
LTNANLIEIISKQEIKFMRNLNKTTNRLYEEFTINALTKLKTKINPKKGFNCKISTAD